MFGRVAFYGFAFGSLSASMVLINFMNRLFMTRSFASVMPLIGNVLIIGFAVYLFVKSLMRQDVHEKLVQSSGKPVSLGKTLFGSLVLALIAALCNIAAYSHIQNNQKEEFGLFKTMQTKAIYQAHNTSPEKVSTLDKKTQKTIQESLVFLDENLSVGSYARVELQMYLSIALIVTLLVYVANSKKQ